VDAEAKKPDDWDDEEDGEWEAPMKDNAEYKGDWKSTKLVPSPITNTVHSKPIRETREHTHTQHYLLRVISD